MSKPFVEIEGFPQLMEKIKQLGDDKSKRQEVLKVLRQVAKPTLEVVRANTPIGDRRAKTSLKTKKSYIPGTLKKAQGLITGKSENPTILVGSRVRGVFKGYYAHWVDRGHRIYRTGFKRKHSSSAKAIAHNDSGTKSGTIGKFFMRKSYEITKGQVTADAEKKFAAYIQRQIDRLSK